MEKKEIERIQLERLHDTIMRAGHIPIDEFQGVFEEGIPK